VRAVGFGAVVAFFWVFFVVVRGVAERVDVGLRRRSTRDAARCDARCDARCEVREVRELLDVLAGAASGPDSRVGAEVGVGGVEAASSSRASC
jgi:hypothetical protein